MACGTSRRRIATSRFMGLFHVVTIQTAFFFGQVHICAAQTRLGTAMTIGTLKVLDVKFVTEAQGNELIWNQKWTG